MQQNTRIGVIWPADGMQDGDVWQFAPRNVSLHFTRIKAPQGAMSVESIRRESESEQVPAAARLLASIPLSCIGYFCTAGSFIGGVGHDVRLIQSLEAAAGVPATTTSTALLRALETLNVHRCAILAPYPKDVTQCLIRFLEDQGGEVVSCTAMEIDQGWEIGEIESRQVLDLAHQLDHPDADAIFISCTNLATAGVLWQLQQELGKPVLSANQVTVWHCLALAGIHESLSRLAHTSAGCSR